MPAQAVYLNPSAPIDRRVDDLLVRMTVDEKIAELSAIFKEPLIDNCDKEDGAFNPARAKTVMPHGLGRISAVFHTFTSARAAETANHIQDYARKHTRLGIPVLIDNEGLHGAMGVGCTSYPQAIGLAATWNPRLIERIAVAIARELKARGVHQVLSPVLDIARDARAGRTEETYGEDPLLVSRMAVAYVKGAQSLRIICTPKHFAANFVADGGRDSLPIHMSQRLLREIYLPPYEAVVKEAGALSMMSAYHSIDGLPCGAHRWLLTDLLRGEWGFKGLVVSDWFAIGMIYSVHCTATSEAEAARQSLIAGMDVELPFAYCFKHLPSLVRKGKLPRRVLDQAVRRALYVKFWSGAFDARRLNPAAATKITQHPDHQRLAAEAARQAVVLLSNDGFLPLKKSIKTLAVLGPNAATARLGGYSAVKVPAVSPLDGLRNLLGARTKILHAEGCPLKAPDAAGIRQAVRLARRADAVVLFMGNSAPETEGEGHDRSNLDLPGSQEELILQVAKANPNVAVVLIGGSAVTMQRWINKVRAVVMGWYPGQAGGAVFAEVLFGLTNPGGRLPITFPKVTGQCPLYYNTKPTGRAYDYNDLRGTQHQFPFGHGLSYTSFAYSNLRVRASGAGKNLKYAVSLDVRNTGRRAGDEVVQLYIRDAYSLRSRPLRELKGFQRVTLKSGQKAAVRFLLTFNDLAYLGDDLKPTLERGNIEILVGGSSEAIHVRWGSRVEKGAEGEQYEGSAVQPLAPDIHKAPAPDPALPMRPVPVMTSGNMRYTDFRELHSNRDGLVYMRTHLLMPAAGPGKFLFGSDGPVRVWINGHAAASIPGATNPIQRDHYKVPAVWKNGKNEILFAVHTNDGRAWGVTCRGVID